MTTMTERVPLDAFLTRVGVRLTLTEADRNPHMAADDDWHRTATHWAFILRRGRESMRGYFSQGSAHTEPPTLADIVDCLASDASGVENAQDFDDWCSEYGYDTDSRKAEKTYKAVQKSTDGLKRVFGEHFETLLWETERL